MTYSVIEDPNLFSVGASVEALWGGKYYHGEIVKKADKYHYDVKFTCDGRICSILTEDIKNSVEIQEKSNCEYIKNSTSIAGNESENMAIKNGIANNDITMIIEGQNNLETKITQTEISIPINNSKKNNQMTCNRNINIIDDNRMTLKTNIHHNNNNKSCFFNDQKNFINVINKQDKTTSSSGFDATEPIVIVHDFTYNWHYNPVDKDLLDVIFFQQKLHSLGKTCVFWIWESLGCSISRGSSTMDTIGPMSYERGKFSRFLKYLLKTEAAHSALLFINNQGAYIAELYRNPDTDEITPVLRKIDLWSHMKIATCGVYLGSCTASYDDVNNIIKNHPLNGQKFDIARRNCHVWGYIVLEKLCSYSLEFDRDAITDTHKYQVLSVKKLQHFINLSWSGYRCERELICNEEVVVSCHHPTMTTIQLLPDQYYEIYLENINKCLYTHPEIYFVINNKENHDENCCELPEKQFKLKNIGAARFFHKVFKTCKNENHEFNIRIECHHFCSAIIKKGRAIYRFRLTRIKYN